MRILCIAPVPPPITGNSVAVEVMIDHLRAHHEVIVVDLSKPSLSNGADSAGRFAQIGRLLAAVWRRHRSVDVIYLTVAESRAGNARDLLIYLLCFRRLARMVIHMHGGANMRRLLSAEHPLLAAANRFFLRRLGAVIVLGPSHSPMYRDAVPVNRTYEVPNFAEDEMFLEEETIRRKFLNTDRLRILFLSNLNEGKGHRELLGAYAMIPARIRARIAIDIAGAAESEAQERAFRSQVASLDGVTYHGAVRGSKKRELFGIAHIFCLPTYYAYEGQPISILEAYASGCVVITTDHSGIRDIFTDAVNGVEVEKGSITSLSHALEGLVTAFDTLLPVALRNHGAAKAKYRTSTYNAALEAILESVGNYGNP